MQLENYGQLKNAVADADLVLVGLGEEWVLSEEHILEDLAAKDKILYEMFLVTKKEEKYQKLLPLLTAYYYSAYIPATWENAYQNLSELLKDKNYFIVSLTVDSYLMKIGFKEERCVNPCGTYNKIQCIEGCTKEIFSSQELLDKVKYVLTNNTKDDCTSQCVIGYLEQCENLLAEYRCAHCGADMVFNILDTKNYLEEGYLEQWQRYMKWLQGTLNKKLCVIEAGVGMKLPSVIRWPFEKTVFYNQKANMFRIHEKFYQVNEEIAERAYGCKRHSVKFLNKENVEA